MTVLERVQRLTADDIDRCEDCPDFNSNPPRHSECPNFDISPDGKPVCTSESDTHKRQRFAKFWSGTGTADRACSCPRLLK
jgi:hypothetical protein